MTLKHIFTVLKIAALFASLAVNNIELQKLVINNRTIISSGSICLNSSLISSSFKCLSLCQLTKCDRLVFNNLKSRCTLFYRKPNLVRNISINGLQITYILEKHLTINQSCLADFACNKSENLYCINKTCTCDQTSYWPVKLSKCVPCITGWFPYKTQMCFKPFNQVNVTWSNSYYSCKSMNASLIILNDLDKFYFFKEYAALNFPKMRVWVGSNTSVPKSFKWLDNTEINPLLWASSDPDNNNRTDILAEGCLALSFRKNHYLVDIYCDSKDGYVCEYS